MKIPTHFQLLCYDIKVEHIEHLLEDNEAKGESRYAKQVLALHTPLRTPDETTQTFFHELVHWILFCMERDELNADEKFVNQFAGLLAQYEKTKEL